jgi:ankyrin repeat protein
MAKGSTVVGTYGYMAPEQFRGDAVPASDLYGLGTTLLFLLTHRVPSDLPQKRLRIHFRDRVQISEAFADWLEKLIEPDVEDRFTSARAALNALQRKVLVSKPIKPLNWAVVAGSGIASIGAITLLVIFRYPVLRVFGFTPPNICYASPEEIKTYLNQWGDPNLVLGCLVGSTRPDLNQKQMEEFVKLLLEKGADVNTKYEDGSTTLMMAIQRDLMDTVKFLVEKGAEVNAENRYYQTPLMMASERGQTDIVKLLIERGANVDAKNMDGLTPLIMTIRGRVPYGAEVNAKDRTDILKPLIEHGANVHTKGRDGFTPLIIAIGHRQVNSIKLLIEKGADVNAKDDHGNTVLMAASQAETIKLLIEKGADVNAKDEDGVTALMKACDRRLQTEFVKLLIEKGADVNAKCNNGCTALMFASELGPTDTIKLLIEKGVDVNAKTKDGRTALSIANQSFNINGHVIYEIVSLLKQHGAKE